eukprot:g72514.t1
MGRSVVFHWLSSGWGDPVMKKVISLLVIALTIYWGYRRIKRAQEADRRRQRQRDAQVDRTNRTSSAPPQAAPKSSMSPAQYLQPHSPKRKVCLSIEKLIFRDSLVPSEQTVAILLSLIRCTQLFLICLCTDKDAEANYIKALNKAGLFAAGLKKHRVLFCTTQKGKIAIFRHTGA